MFFFTKVFHYKSEIKQTFNVHKSFFVKVSQSCLVEEPSGVGVGSSWSRSPKEAEKESSVTEEGSVSTPETGTWKMLPSAVLGRWATAT